jgi:hypothetical protein
MSGKRLGSREKRSKRKINHSKTEMNDLDKANLLRRGWEYFTYLKTEKIFLPPSVKKSKILLVLEIIEKYKRLERLAAVTRQIEKCKRLEQPRQA